MEELVDYARDTDRWSTWTIAILDPEHASSHYNYNYYTY